MAPGIVFGEINEPRINNAGQVMFHSNLTGPGISSADAAIWLHDSGNLRLIVREGTSADVIGLGINHGSFGYAYLNGVGQVTFTGGLTGRRPYGC